MLSEHESTIPHILVVDDEVSVARFLKELLESNQYNVSVETDSRKALSLFDSSPDTIDLMVTDHRMPELTGVELARGVLKKRPDLPIILCTGFSEISVKKNAVATGIKGYLNKPIDNMYLLELIENLLKDKHP